MLLQDNLLVDQKPVKGASSKQYSTIPISEKAININSTETTHFEY
jgi:hypothetical protein